MIGVNFVDIYFRMGVYVLFVLLDVFGVEVVGVIDVVGLGVMEFVFG